MIKELLLLPVMVALGHKVLTFFLRQLKKWQRPHAARTVEEPEGKEG